MKYFSKCDFGGVLAVQKFFLSPLCSEIEPGGICCFCILVGFLEKTGHDPKSAKLAVPTAVRFKEMMETNKITLQVMQQGVQLIHLMTNSVA